MSELHGLLRRQLKRLQPSADGVPVDWRPLIEAVDAAYRQSDADRAMLERSLELSSQELLQANDDMRGMFRAFPDLFFRLAADGTILDQRGSRREGLPRRPDAFLGRRIQEVFGDAVGERFEEALARVREGEALVSIEVPFPQGAAEGFWEARLVPLPRREVVALVRDISERKGAELEREEHLALFRSLIETMDAGVLVERPDRTVFAANTAFCLIFGLPGPAESLVGADYAGVAEASKSFVAEPEAFPRRIDEILAAAAPVAAEEISFADGRIFERDYSRICSSDGRFIGHMWQYRDVTERRSLQLQLLQSQKMEAVGRLAGGVAHDFNNLLTAILGYSELLAGSLSDRNALQHIEEVKKAGQRAAALTKQLLAFSRKQVLQTKVLDLNDIVDGLGSMLERLISENIRVTARLQPRLGRIRADAGQLEQVILNLAVNARDAMRDGGELILETGEVTVVHGRPQEHPDLQPGTYVMLTVKDTGCGMDLETRSQIFEPFFTTKEEGHGTGLGLSTVYGIVKQCGGVIWVTSEPGRGATFKICFPRVDEPQEAGLNQVAALEGEGSGTILVLEDEASLRALTRQILASSGYEVLEAASGEEALDLAERFAGHIDLLLTDVVLPDRGGPSVAVALQERRPAMKVLYMSGYTDSALLRHGADEGSKDFLSKPFTPMALLDRVSHRLQG